MSGKDLKSIFGSKCHPGMNVETQAFWDNLSPWAEGPTVRSLTQMSDFYDYMEPGNMLRAEHLCE